MEDRHVMQVDVTRLVPVVKPQLLLTRQTSHGSPGNHALVECIRRVVEATTVDIGLPTVAIDPEDDRMEVDPAAARRNQLDPHRAPVSLYPVAAPLQDADC
jgi:hypothetical protein